MSKSELISPTAHPITVAASTKVAATVAVADPKTPIEVRLVVLDSGSRPLDVSDAQHEEVGFLKGYGLFASLVLAPCLIAAIYLFGIASDRYLSQAQFVIRSPTSSGYESTASAVTSHGLSHAQDEMFMVCEYIQSRDAFAHLRQLLDLRTLFGSGNADLFNRFPNFYSRDNQESFYRYYKKRVSCEVDESTGISTIRVTAFTPTDAQAVAKALMVAAEDLLNRLNERADVDAVRLANRTVEENRNRVATIERELKDYRSQIGIVNDQSENAAALKTITALSTEIAHMDAELQQLTNLSPNSPAIASLRMRIASYAAEIGRRNAAIAGGSHSLASKMAKLDMLDTEKAIAAKEWAVAEAERDAALRNSRRQHLYLQPVVQPNVEDQPSYPRRWLFLALTFVAGELLFLIVRTLRQFAMEHAL